MYTEYIFSQVFVSISENSNNKSICIREKPDPVAENIEICKYRI